MNEDTEPEDIEPEAKLANNIANLVKKCEPLRRRTVSPTDIRDHLDEAPLQLAPAQVGLVVPLQPPEQGPVQLVEPLQPHQQAEVRLAHQLLQNNEVRVTRLASLLKIITTTMLDARVSVSVSVANNALSRNVVRLKNLGDTELKRLFQHIMIEAISHMPLIEGAYDSASEQQELEHFITLAEFQGPPQEDPGTTILGVLNAARQAVGMGGAASAVCVILFNLRTLYTHIQDDVPKLLELELLSILELETFCDTFRSLCKIIRPFTPYALSLCRYIGIRDNLVTNELLVLRNAERVLVPMDAKLGNLGVFGRIPLIARFRALIKHRAFITTQRTLEVIYLAACVRAVYPNEQAMVVTVLSNNTVQRAIITVCKLVVADVASCVLWRFNPTPRRRNVRRDDLANVGGIRRRKHTLYSKRKNRQPKRRVTRKINNRPKTKKNRKKQKKTEKNRKKFKK